VGDSWQTLCLLGGGTYAGMASLVQTEGNSREFSPQWGYVRDFNHGTAAPQVRIRWTCAVHGQTTEVYRQRGVQLENAGVE
jgi:hypothetical protein